MAREAWCLPNLDLTTPGESLQMQNQCAEVKLRAERRAGEMLREMEKHPAGRPSENRSHDVTDFPPRLADLGITKMQSHRWQKIASVPEEAFEQHIDASKTTRGTGMLISVDNLSTGSRRLRVGIFFNYIYTKNIGQSRQLFRATPVESRF